MLIAEMLRGECALTRGVSEFLHEDMKRMRNKKVSIKEKTGIPY
jgi:hypothetical protein